jgi:hypothetical protein
MHPRVITVRPLSPFTVELTFADGTRGTVDLSRWIVGSEGVFAALQERAYFRRVTVDPEAGTIVWPNGADLDPDVLYELAQQAHTTT